MEVGDTELWIPKYEATKPVYLVWLLDLNGAFDAVKLHRIFGSSFTVDFETVKPSRTEPG